MPQSGDTSHGKVIFRLVPSRKCCICSLLNMCTIHSGLDWAVATCLGMWVVGLECPGHRDFAMSAVLANLVMNITLSLNVEAYGTS